MLFSYKMTHDTGFAPNPFHNIMTLANCKPLIRKIKTRDVYIAGFTSKALCGEKMGEERLVYIMRVTDKLSYAQYYTDVHFKCKIPSKGSLISKAGDNIYKPSDTEKIGFIQLDNWNHKYKNINHDLSGEYVLISNNFFYFGSGAIPVERFKINIPRVQSAHGVKTDNIEDLLTYLKENYQPNVVLNRPHSWIENEPYN
ncbi:MAG: hypothetical protein V4685_10780 [Bacteroidota bacterium]